MDGTPRRLESSPLAEAAARSTRDEAMIFMVLAFDPLFYEQKSTMWADAISLMSLVKELHWGNDTSSSESILVLLLKCKENIWEKEAYSFLSHLHRNM